MVIPAFLPESWGGELFRGPEFQKLLLAPCFLLPIFLILLGQKVFQKRKLSDLAINKPPYPRRVWFVFLIALPLALQLLGAEIDALGQMVFPFPEFYRQMLESLQPTGSLSDAIGAYLTIALVGPLCEEILFRGILLPGLYVHYQFRKWPAILVSAALFGLSHLNPYQLLYAMPAGVVLGYLRFETRGLTVPIVVHVCNNLIAVIALYHLSELPYFVSAESEIVHLPVSLMMAAGVLFALSLRYIVKRRLGVSKGEFDGERAEGGGFYEGGEGQGERI